MQFQILIWSNIRDSLMGADMQFSSFIEKINK